MFYLQGKQRGGIDYKKVVVFMMLICLFMFTEVPTYTTQVQAQTSSTSNVTSIKKAVTTDMYITFDENNLLDWIHFAKDNVDDLYRKINPVANNKIGFNGVGMGTANAPTKERATDYGYYCTWTEADPVSSAANVQSAIYYCGEGSCFDITAPSKIGVKRTLNVYMANYASKVDITATMGNESYSVEGVALNNTLEKYLYTFEYTGDSTQNDLVIRFSLAQGNDADWCNIGITAVTLSEAAIQEATGTAMPVQYISQDTYVNLADNNVVDWLHFNNTTPNRRAGTDIDNQLTATHNGTKPGFEHNIGQNGKVLVSYNNGTTIQDVTNGRQFSQFTGLNSYFEITAPSKNNVERKLDVCMGSWAGKLIEVSASIGGNDIPVDHFTMASPQTKYAKYSFHYTGTDSNEQLVVRFTLTDNSLDTSWASLILSAVAVTEGESTGNGNVIRFKNPELTGNDAVIVPASGVSKRRLTAQMYDSFGNIIEGYVLDYRIETMVNGITLVGNQLEVSSNVADNATVTIIAEDPNNQQVTARTTVEIVKNSMLNDIQANPIDKDGWVLYFNDEFNDNKLDPTIWSEYYLRNWTDEDNKTKADYYFDEGHLVIKTDEGIQPWSPQDGQIAVKSITSFEKNHLHKFGSAHTNREIPKFDGLATKYGYFEIRLKMPNTRDGSHFAWWMTGVQDDQNVTAQLAGQNTYVGHTSNETGEFDIIEISLENLKHWRPVIHSNGSTDYQYEHVPATTIPGDPGNEFHIYGFEWDENGTKFYLDNQLVKTSTRTPNYRMMTYFSVYSTGGMGTDRNIYPKEAIIDYFRIYKKSEPRKPSGIELNNGNTPNFVKVPLAGNNSVQMTANVLDQFDDPINAVVRWKLSETVDGFTPTTSQSARLNGVSIDSDTGILTVASGANTNQDLFVTAYVNDKVKQTYHMRLSTASEYAEKVIFDNASKTVVAGETIQVSAQLYNQYKQPMSGKSMHYQISQDITGNEVKAISGVAIDQNGNLTVGSNVPKDTIIIVTAKADGKYQNCILKVTTNE